MTDGLLRRLFGRMGRKAAPRRVLFVCTGNTCRSAMAEQLFRRRLEQAGAAGFEVGSAGVAAYPGMASPPELLAVLGRLGAEGSAHRSRALNRDLAAWADLILVMEQRQKDNVAARFPWAAAKVHVLKTFVDASGPPDIPDPVGKSVKIFEECAAEIVPALEKLAEKIRPAEAAAADKKGGNG